VLVYRDHEEIVDPRQRLEGLRETLSSLGALSGLERHSKLVSTLIDAGMLAQGLADARFAYAQVDARDEATDSFGDFLHRLAASVLRSFDSGFAVIGRLPPVPPLEDLPGEVALRRPEGFAFYAVYPESYARAARRLTLQAPPLVIGIRSIGTTLGAMVAAALQAPPGVTLRPFGDPFARQIAVSSKLERELLADDFHYVVVDEGPGQSGSSFGAVADWLEERGVSADRIAFVPSHGGNSGARSSDAHRRRWREAQRVPAGFDSVWLEHLFGPLETMSGGERLKFLCGRDGERLLLKFAGFGEIGERKLAMARALHGAGLTTEPVGLVHGFLVERWCEGRGLEPDERPMEEIGRYIGARARLFPAGNARGATIEELLTMCRRNFSVALGAELPGSWDPAALSHRITRVRTDNKLDRCEWLRMRDGRLLKCDALDHHQGHDLIGCQDAAWDVAGAIVEFDVEANETERLIGPTNHSLDRELLEFYRMAYCCFRVGQASLAPNGSSAERYTKHLGLLLHQHSAARESAEILI
jgi:hypothetical protein